MKRSSYREMLLTYDQFEDLVLIGIADRDADHVDEVGDRLPDTGTAFLYSIKKVAEDEGFLFEADWPKRAMSEMEQQGLVTHDGDPDDPNDDGLRVYLDPAGYERARRLIGEYYGDDSGDDENSAIPASDRIVTLNHNSPDYLKTIQALENVILLLKENNKLRGDDPLDQEQRSAELDAGKILLKPRRISVKAVTAVLLGPLGYLATKFADAPLGEAAQWAWTMIKALIGM